jgi:threonine synthase
MRCVIISTGKISRGWRRAIEVAGAELLLTDTPKARWVLMKERIENEGWYPVTNYLDPPVGSNPFGVDGYKSTAYEILEACGAEPPTVILVPTSRGDLLWGLWQGFHDGVRFGLSGAVPRLVAVEPAPRLSMVLRDADYRQTFPEVPHAMVSIGGGTVTYQAMCALRNTRGSAVEVTMEEALRAQVLLAGHGFYAELSSAAALAGLRVLSREDGVKPRERVVLIITSHGYKDPPIGG